MKNQDEYGIDQIELEDLSVIVQDEYLSTNGESYETGVVLLVDGRTEVRLSLSEVRQIHEWLQKSQAIAGRLGL